MLEKILEQKFDENGEIIFKQGHSPDYSPSNQKTIRNIVCLEKASNLHNLIKALKHNTHLTEFHLDNHELADEQAKELGEVLAIHPSLDKLSITNCNLTRQGAIHLANGITKNKNIHMLVLDQTTFAENSIDEIENALKNNHFITTFQHEELMSKATVQTSIARNKEFFELRAKVEEHFSLLESFFEIKPKDEKPKRLIRIQRLLDPTRWAQVSEQKRKVINSGQKVDEDTQVNGAFIILNSMLTCFDKLKEKGFNACAYLSHRIACISAQFYLTVNAPTEFYKLYGEHFILFPDPIIDLEFAKKIFPLEKNLNEYGYHDKLNLETKKILSSLGLYNNLRYEYFIKRLENNKDSESVKICAFYRKKLNELALKTKRKTKSQNTTIDRENTTRNDEKQIAINPQIEKQIYLKFTIANNLSNGPYNRIFSEKYIESKMIEWGHSRIVSAERLSMISKNFTYVQMIQILQVEYAALPDEDKKATSSFLTAYRHRTLEKALEDVFEKNSIATLSPEFIKQNSNLSLAVALLQWIGDKERSFRYKSSPWFHVISHFQELGNIAHKMIVCTDETSLKELKKQALEKLNDKSVPRNATALIQKLNLKISSAQPKAPHEEKKNPKKRLLHVKKSTTDYSLQEDIQESQEESHVTNSKPSVTIGTTTSMPAPQPSIFAKPPSEPNADQSKQEAIAVKNYIAELFQPNGELYTKEIEGIALANRVSQPLYKAFTDDFYFRVSKASDTNDYKIVFSSERYTTNLTKNKKLPQDAPCPVKQICHFVEKIDEKWGKGTAVILPTEIDRTQDLTNYRAEISPEKVKEIFSTMPDNKKSLVNTV